MEAPAIEGAEAAALLNLIIAFGTRCRRCECATRETVPANMNHESVQFCSDSPEQN